MVGKLYIVATPIGNLGDITFRAVEVLKNADIIACEDTRRAGKLLKEFGIECDLFSYHDHNEREVAAKLGEFLSSGRTIAVISDAGTPGIADPGFRAVEEAVSIGAEVVPIPGPTALVSALSVSGLPTDSFFFGGFLPSKRGERIRRLTEVREIPATLLFYETPHRISASLADCLQVLGNRRAVLARELTKLHEQIVRGSISTLIDSVKQSALKGEMVLIFGRAEEDLTGNLSNLDSLRVRYEELLASGTDSKRALKTISRETGLSRSEVYRELHILDPQNG